MRIITAIAAFLLVVLPTPGRAKCSFALYAVTGSLELPEELRSEEVRIYLFLAGTNVTSAYHPGPGEADFNHPSADGQFQVTVRLSTSSGYSRLFGDRCRRVEVRGDLFVTGDRIRSRRLSIKFQQSKAEIRRTHRAQATVGKILLALLPTEDSLRSP